MIIYAIVSPTMGYAGFYKYSDDAYKHLDWIDARYNAMWAKGDRANARHDYRMEPVEVREEYNGN